MIILVLGGTRSGKSVVAERLVTELPDPVSYVATARLDPGDEDHAARIRRHRARRPEDWTTIECTDADQLPAILEATRGTVLLDSLGTWVTAHPSLQPDVGALVAALAHRHGDTVVVSEEVGLSPHAPTELGRRFTDALGEANHAVSSAADRALLVVAGRALELPPC